MSINKALFSSNSDNWETPQDLFDSLDREFHFDLDVCADHYNHKCPAYFTKDQDGLSQFDYWSGHVWCNPPYGREISNWVSACSLYNGLSVMLLPARTDTRWFHEFIYNRSNVQIRFIKGRLKFGHSKNSAPFPSMIVIFNA